jgi:hypothetical protein
MIWFFNKINAVFNKLANKFAIKIKIALFQIWIRKNFKIIMKLILVALKVDVQII